MDLVERFIETLGVPALLGTVVGGLIWGFRALIKTFQREVDRLFETFIGMKDTLERVQDSIEDLKRDCADCRREKDLQIADLSFRVRKQNNDKEQNSSTSVSL